MHFTYSFETLCKYGMPASFSRSLIMSVLGGISRAMPCSFVQGARGISTPVAKCKGMNVNGSVSIWVAITDNQRH